MYQFVIHRIAMTIPVILGIIVITALLIRLIPGDPVDTILGEQATLEDKQQLRFQLGLDRSAWSQLRSYVSDLVRGDLGSSLINNRPVASMIFERMLPTFLLAISSMILAIIISLPLGMLAAAYANSKVDYTLMTLALLGVAIPNFWLGPLLVMVFSIQLNWFPVSGMTSIMSFVLPSITLGTALAAILSRLTRNTMLSVLSEDFIRTARSKGVRENVIFTQHAFRNTLIPLTTVIGLQFGVLLTGAVITETIFDWPGLGLLIVGGLQSRDYPIVQGCVLVFALSYVIVNFATDVLYGFIDPRIRLGRGSS